MIKRRVFIFIVILIFAIMPASVWADEDVQLNWIEGPTTVDMGDDLATLQLSDSLLFLDKTDTEKYNDLIGNISTGMEIGTVVPKDEGQNWYVMFEYEDVGYVNDDDKEEIDADKILEAYSEGTEEGNKIREERGIPAMHVVGWDESPHYDEATHNLVWSMLLESEGEQFLNYNTRILSRYGYVSATLATDVGTIDAVRPQMREIINQFQFKEGKRYEDFNETTDKMAGYGLTALIAGGAGVAAAKVGFFAKIILIFKKFFIVILAAIYGIYKFIRKRMNGE